MGGSERKKTSIARNLKWDEDEPFRGFHISVRSMEAQRAVEHYQNTVCIVLPLCCDGDRHTLKSMSRGSETCCSLIVSQAGAGVGVRWFLP